jgi:hypothetical protein
LAEVIFKALGLLTTGLFIVVFGIVGVSLGVFLYLIY